MMDVRLGDIERWLLESGILDGGFRLGDIGLWMLDSGILDGGC